MNTFTRMNYQYYQYDQFSPLYLKHKANMNCIHVNLLLTDDFWDYTDNRPWSINHYCSISSHVILFFLLKIIRPLSFQIKINSSSKFVYYKPI